MERQLNFPDGIPAEYDWLGVRDAALRARGGSGVQRMTADAWLLLIAEESEQGEGHLLPAAAVEGAGEEGPCGCPRCAARVEVWQDLLKA